MNGFQSADARNHTGFKSKAEDVTELPDSGSQMRSEGRGASNKIVPAQGKVGNVFDASDAASDKVLNGGLKMQLDSARPQDYISRLLEADRNMSLKQERAAIAQDHEVARRKIKEYYAKEYLRSKVAIVKPFDEMTPEEKKARIKRLWTKARLFVRIRAGLNKVQVDIDRKFFKKMMLQEQSEDDDNEYNSDDDERHEMSSSLPFYQFNRNSSFMVFW